MAWFIGSKATSANGSESDHSENLEIPVANWHFMIRVVFDVIVLSALAIFFAVIINYIIPAPTPDEPTSVTIWLLITQMVIATVMLLIIEFIYIKFFGHSTSTFFVAEVFILLFFIAQPQIFARTYNIAKRLFAQDITLESFSDPTRELGSHKAETATTAKQRDADYQ